MAAELSSSSSSSSRVLVWSYGSNGVVQLRARCQNTELAARPAFIKDFARVFCLWAADWRGGVASICPAPDAVTYGSLVSLTLEEKRRLDAFEGGYREERVEVWERVGGGEGGVVGGGVVKRSAVTYVAGHVETPFTPALSKRPSEAYLVAIDLHLRQSWGGTREIAVKSSAAPAEVLASWRHPGVDCLETLEAVAVEANALKRNAWTMPRASLQFSKDLAAVGVRTVQGLADALAADDLGRALEALRARDAAFWDDDALEALRALPIQRVFVYGTLQRGLSNHARLLEGRFLRVARTKDDYALVMAPGGGFPFGVRPQNARPDSARGPLLGELYAVSTRVLHASLDPLESHPHFYARERVPVVERDAHDEELGDAWVYFLVEDDALHDMAVRRPHAYPDVVPTCDYKANQLSSSSSSSLENDDDAAARRRTGTFP